MKPSRLFTFLGIPVIGLILAGMGIFIGKVMLDRGFNGTEASFYLNRAVAMFSSDKTAFAEWLIGIPLLSYQPALLFYPFSGDLAPVVASSVGLALCLAVLLVLVRSHADRVVWIPSIMILFLLHPSVFFTALTGSSFYLVALLTVGFVWSATEWFDRRADNGLYGMGLFWAGMILVNPGFVPLGLLIYPALLLTAINDLLRKEYATNGVSATIFGKTSDDVRTSHTPGHAGVTPATALHGVAAPMQANFKKLTALNAVRIPLLLNGDIPVGLSTLRKAFKSTAAMLFIPGVVLSLYGFSRLMVVTIAGAPWYNASSDLLFLAGAYSVPAGSNHSFAALMSEMGNDLPSRLLVVLPVVGLALFRLHDQPMKFYIGVAPVLALFLTALGPLNGFVNAVPELIFIVSMVTVLRSTPATSGLIERLSVVSVFALSAFFGYHHLQQTSSPDLIAARSAFMFETGSKAPPLARFMEGQSDEITFRIPSDTDFTDDDDNVAREGLVDDSLAAVAAEAEATRQTTVSLPGAPAASPTAETATTVASEPPSLASSLATRPVAAADTTPPAGSAPPMRTQTTTTAGEPPPAAATDTALPVTGERPARETASTTPPPTRLETSLPGATPSTGISGIPGGIAWDDSERYYFEVRITANTGAAATRNYNDWIEQAGAENVTLMPQYREGRIIRWLIGTDRHQTFRLAVAAIQDERGAEAVNNAFVTLYHLTDFRVFGDAPNFNPDEPGFTLLLGSYTSRDQALEKQRQWQAVGLDQTWIMPVPGRHILLTGRYNERAEAELLAMIIGQKSGELAEVIPLP
jgi:hypothetical protein